MVDSLQLVETETRLTIPVAIVLQRFVDPDKRWGYPEWSVHSVISGESIPNDSQQVTIHDDGAVHRIYHGGLHVNLFKDGSEGYWYNLLSDTPYLFVVCEGEQGAMEIDPFYVTVNQDEATGHLESEDIVLSIEMPAEMRDLLEHYVVNHYQPEVKKKRKRRDWLKDSEYANKQDGNEKSSH